MDNRDRELRIARMKRERRRQEQRRKRSLAIMKRCLTVGGVVAIVLLVITGIWALVKPLTPRETVDKGQEETQADIDNKENDNVINQSGEPTQDEPVLDESTSEESTNQDADTEMMLVNDGPATRIPILNVAELVHAIPGWQIDDNGWWYANKDNTYYENGWVTLDGRQYFFDANGYMQTGWVPIGGKGCFFSDSGEYQPDKERKMLALTFDDGPGKYTERLLDILAENNAKATFFMIGKNIGEKHGYLVERMLADGHELGNHSFSHPNLMGLSEEGIREEFSSTDEQIKKITGGEVATLARTPFGAQDDVVLRNIDKPVIYWDIDTKDWQTKNVNSNIEIAMTAEEGSIILMHDIHEATVQSCEQIIPQLMAQGYELVTVTELARAHGVEMQNGVTYYSFTERQLAGLSVANANEEGTE